MTRRPSRSLALVVGLALASPAVGGALARAAEPKDAEPPVDAAQFFRAGRAAYDRKEFRAAALAFREAYRRAPRAAALYNAARAWEAAGEAELAADDFARAASGDLDPEDAAYARTRLAALEPSLATVRVTAPAGALVLVRGAERGEIPATVHLAPGTHDIHVHRRDGFEVVRTVTLARAGAHEELAVDAGPPAAAPPPAPPPKPLPPPAPPEPPPTASPPTLAWVGLAAAGAFAIGGGYTYFRFTDARGTFESGGSHDATLRDSAQGFRTWTYVLWGGAAALGVTTAILFLGSGGGDGRPPRAALRIGPATLGLDLAY